MQNAIYNNKTILAVDIVYPYVENFKELSKKSILKCPCCKQIVVLKYGEKKIPHFAHKETNPNCIMCKQKKDVLKMIEEAQLDFIMKLREIYKNELININLNVLKDDELIHLQLITQDKNILNIRFVEKSTDKILKDCINILLCKGEKENIEKAEIFKYLIKYNISKKIFIRGFFDMKTKKIIKYFCQMEDFNLIDKKIDFKQFKKRG